MTVSETLAAFVTTTRFADLGPSQITAAKEAISDCLACTIAGSVTATRPVRGRAAWRR